MYWRVRSVLGFATPKPDDSFPQLFPLNGTIIEGVPEQPGWIRVTSHGTGTYLVETRYLVPQ